MLTIRLDTIAQCGDLKPRTVIGMGVSRKRVAERRLRQTIRANPDRRGRVVLVIDSRGRKVCYVTIYRKRGYDVQ